MLSKLLPGGDGGGVLNRDFRHQTSDIRPRTSDLKNLFTTEDTEEHRGNSVRSCAEVLAVLAASIVFNGLL